MEERNHQIARRFEEKMEVWSSYLRCKKAAEDRNGTPPNFPRDPHTGAVMKRKPQAPGNKKYDTEMVQCMAALALCCHEGTDARSTCFALCRIRDLAQDD